MGPLDGCQSQKHVPVLQTRHSSHAQAEEGVHRKLGLDLLLHRHGDGGRKHVRLIG